MWPNRFNFFKSEPSYDSLSGSSSPREPTMDDGEASNQSREKPGRFSSTFSRPSTSTTTAKKSWFQRTRQPLLSALRLLSVWIVLITAWRTTLHPVPRTVRYEKQTLICGNTTAEAESRGCVFDMLSHNWVAPACLDPVTEAEYRTYVTNPARHFGPYPYYIDNDAVEGGLEHIDDERAFAQLADSPVLIMVHTTREEHLAHCEFLLRRTARAADGKVRMNDENLQFWHAEHCLHELRHADRKPMDELNEGFYVGYSPCTVEVPV
ncbi:hypothetical protein NKR19_g3515 [Coniochaeta hoffmannii]|uniref:Uncharacterized protein n=1 Tax=Coniochaeta hoffmannii TaxID=91930 RepID=A0AA38VYR8_9PEZI|nr:hypothetical protein NKR19_g3515 [Coniochaeta hoffmannii]